MEDEIKIEPEIVLQFLRDLNVGDRFYAVSDKKKINRYQVASKGLFNIRHGTAIRKCWNERTADYENKSGNLKVIKLKSHDK